MLLPNSGFEVRCRWIRLLVIFVTLALVSPVSYTAVELVTFDQPAKQKLYIQLTQELRCMVCQNQNLADSNADLAVDLKRKVRTMVADGKSYADVVDYMVARYGDFVLYRPPLQLSTLFLWASPLLLLLIALIVFFVKKRREREAPLPSELMNADAQQRIRTLLEENVSSDRETNNS